MPNKMKTTKILMSITTLGLMGASLAKVILKTRSDRWWFGDPKDGWWVYRSGDIKK